MKPPCVSVYGDDSGKIADLAIPPFETYLPLLRRLS